MTRTRRNSSWLKGLVLTGPLLIAAVVGAEPTDLTPTDINGSKLDPRHEEGGSYSVSERSGATTYSYHFELPPARTVVGTNSVVVRRILVVGPPATKQRIGRNNPQVAIGQ